MAESKMATSTRWVRDVVVGLIILALIRADFSVWVWALTPRESSITPVEAPEPSVPGSWHEWRVQDKTRRAFTIETGAPNYMGEPGFSVTGFDEHHMPIWTQLNVTELERVR